MAAKSGHAARKNNCKSLGCRELFTRFIYILLRGPCPSRRSCSSRSRAKCFKTLPTAFAGSGSSEAAASRGTLYLRSDIGARGKT